MHIQTTHAANPLLAIRPATVDRPGATPSAAPVDIAATSDASQAPVAARSADVNDLTRGLNAASTAQCTGPGHVGASGESKYTLDIGNSQSDGAAAGLVADDLPPTNPTSPTPPADAPTMDTLLQVVGAWDTSNPQFDFTNDGVVNIHDLLHAIRNGITVACPGPDTQQPPKPNDLSSAAMPSPSTIDAITDVVANGQLEKSPPADAPPAPAEKAKSQHEADRMRQVDVRSQKLVDSLIERLNQNGFEEQPPVNIRELVDQLNLRPSQMNFIMHRLGEHYPMGLGVNLKA